MFKHVISELKEALVCLQPGRVTLGYPFEPHPPQGEFRGLPAVNVETCIGCGACANACPPRLISVQDETDYRHIAFELSRCTYCACCRDVCPVDAIVMSPAFETATPNRDDLRIELQLLLVRCRECGDVVGTRRGMERVKEILAREVNLNLHETNWSSLCIQCRRQASLLTPALVEDLDYERLNA
jgi:hydrogenase-4 component H